MRIDTCIMYLLLKMDNYGKRETVECGVSCDLLEAPPLKLFEPRERRENEDAALDRRSEDELDEEGSHEDDGDHDDSEEDKKRSRKMMSLNTAWMKNWMNRMSQSLEKNIVMTFPLKSRFSNTFFILSFKNLVASSTGPQEENIYLIFESALLLLFVKCFSCQISIVHIKKFVCGPIRIIF